MPLRSEPGNFSATTFFKVRLRKNPSTTDVKSTAYIMKILPSWKTLEGIKVRTRTTKMIGRKYSPT